MLIGNRLCAKRVEEAKQAKHVHKLHNMKPGIDNRVPASANLKHLRVNAKREQLKEDNYTEIDRANRVLLQRMSEIIHKPSIVSSFMSWGQELRSLNREARKKELKRITDENQGILKRIQSIQPAYDHLQWEQDYRRTRQYLRNTCELPFVLGGEEPVCEIPSLEDGSPVSGRQDQSNQPIISEPHGLSPQKGFRYLAKEGRRMGDTFYLIEAVTTDGENLCVSAFSGHEAEGELELHFDAHRHRELLKEVQGDYSKLIDRVRIRGGRICLL
jgi:hypothetical protein